MTTIVAPVQGATILAICNRFSLCQSIATPLSMRHNWQ
jgi:hypothetical protein